MARHPFCSDVCNLRGEPHAGTGDAPRRVLMLAWPRGKWRAPRWESVGMSTELAATLHKAAQAKLHVALVDKVEAEGSLPTLHALPENVYADFSSEAELIEAMNNYLDGKVFEGKRDHRPTILCCTDSRRDACCARHGFSTYKALVSHADPSRFNVVQATHLGGCRFAASLVVMPQRQRYGRMSAEHAADFLEAIGQGEVYLPTYKGRTDTPEAAQVAELAALGWAADHGMKLGPVVISGAIPKAATDRDRLTLEADLSGTRLAVNLQARDFLVQGNCGIVAEGGGDITLRWCLDTITPQPASGTY